MLKTLSLTSSSTISESIDMADEDEVDRGKSGGNETNLSNLSASKRSTRAGYLTFGGTKKGGGNIKKDVKAARGWDYLTLAAKKAFNYLRYAFTQAPIPHHFDLKWYIRIETDALGYAIGKAPSQLTLYDLGQWHPVAYYLHKIILAKTWYKTHDGELLAIVEAFKTWQYYLKGCKNIVFVFINYNNLCRFIDMSFCLVW